MPRQILDKREPANSFEVSYAISVYRPNIELDITRLELNRTISKERREEIREWGDQHFTGRWFRDHV